VTSGATQSQRRRVIGSAAIGPPVGVVVALFAPWELAMLAAWIAVAALLLVRIWFRVGQFTPAQTRELATREDDSRAYSDLLILVASIASLGGAAAGLIKAHSSDSTRETLLTVASVLTVAVSWALVHTVFALRYARLYYGEPEGGIDFNEEHAAPDYGDFAYVAFTIGMTFQVSDTDIGSRIIRRTVLRHALISYLFGAIIVAMMVNVIASLLNG